ncbi:MAG: hypothetical protein IJD83_08910 [Clostridia bacterium]|nr:hypothetical protein [Clostridia bacterium]
MKKLLALLLAVSLVLAFAACGKASKEDAEETVGTNVEQTAPEKEKQDDKKAEDKKEEAKPEDKKEDKKETAKEEEKKEDKKEEAKPEENKPAAAPEKTPESVPVAKPEEKPAPTPEEKLAESATTVGNALLADFKAKAGGAPSMLSLAESLISNDMIPFMGGAMEVEPGLLAGFGNAEIKGFKSGASFMPMMGSIAFVGYVFELEEGTAVSDFIATLKSNADLRWNVCVEADEMVTGNVGNKVFFVMCPKQFEE